METSGETPTSAGAPDAAAAKPSGSSGGKAQQKGRRQMDDAFMMYLYKIKLCTRTTTHNWKLCPWAHPGETAALRRHPSCHKAELCPAVRQHQECPHGEGCMFSRNAFECWLHPDRYRTTMCSSGEGCTRNICFFAHNQQELRMPTLEQSPPPAQQQQLQPPAQQLALAQAQQQALGLQQLDVRPLGAPISSSKSLPSECGTGHAALAASIINGARSLPSLSPSASTGGSAGGAAPMVPHQPPAGVFHALGHLLPGVHVAHAAGGAGDPSAHAEHASLLPAVLVPCCNGLVAPTSVAGMAGPQQQQGLSINGFIAGGHGAAAPAAQHCPSFVASTASDDPQQNLALLQQLLQQQAQMRAQQHNPQPAHRHQQQQPSPQAGPLHQQPWRRQLAPPHMQQQQQQQQHEAAQQRQQQQAMLAHLQQQQAQQHAQLLAQQAEVQHTAMLLHKLRIEAGEVPAWSLDSLSSTSLATTIASHSSTTLPQLSSSSSTLPQLSNESLATPLAGLGGHAALPQCSGPMLLPGDVTLLPMAPASLMCVGQAEEVGSGPLPHHLLAVSQPVAAFAWQPGS